MNLSIQSINILLLIPLIWRQWGSLELGVYLVITAINRFSYLFADRLGITFSTLVSFVDTGSSDLCPREVLEDNKSIDQVVPGTSERNKVLFGRVYGTLGSLLLIISLCVGAIGCVVGPASIHRLGDEFAQLPHECMTAFWISIFAIVVRLNFFRYEILLQGLNRVALLARWNAIFNLISSFACLGVILAGFSILVWSLVFNGMILVACLRNVMLADAVTDGELRTLPLFAWDRGVLASIWGPTWRGMIGHVSLIGAEQFAVLSAPFFLSSLDAVSVSVYIRFLSTIGPIAQVPYASQVPRFARMIANGEVDRLRRLSIQRIAISGILVVLGGWGVGVVFAWFPFLLGREFISTSLVLWGVFVFLIFQDRFSILCIHTMEVGNKVVLYGQKAFCVLLTMLAFPIFCRHFGITGAILSLYAPRAILLSVTPARLAANYLLMSPKTIWKLAWLPAALLQITLWFGLGGLSIFLAQN